jgi:glutamate dehydrogenase/leucine dehydrogenase
MPDINGPLHIGDQAVWTIQDDGPDGRHVSCIAVTTSMLKPRGHRDGRRRALGGTRWLTGRSIPHDEALDTCISTARQLATAMEEKHAVLRHSVRRLASSGRWPGDPGLFDWAGGKGCIWTEWDPAASYAENQRRHLTPWRLGLHAQLVEHLGGLYVASKDQGVGTDELELMSRTTSHLIGLGCERDTGEGTARGAAVGIAHAALRAGLIDGPLPSLATLSEVTDAPLDGLVVLVSGLGKVGLPLALDLHRLGADVRLWDPNLAAVGADRHLVDVQSRGAAVDDRHNQLLRQLVADGRSYTNESAALAAADIAVLSPNGGATGWLCGAVHGSSVRTARADVLAKTARDGGALRVVVGAGNDQLPVGAAAHEDREQALSALEGASILLVPDTVVSPGGVIAVSHERSPTWDRRAVLRDVDAVVRSGIELLFDSADRQGPVTTRGLFAALELLKAPPREGGAAPAGPSTSPSPDDLSGLVRDDDGITFSGNV